MKNEDLDTEELKSHVMERNTWLRLLYMVIFLFFVWVASFVFGVLILALWLWQLFTGQLNAYLQEFGQSLSTWGYQVLRFLSFNTEELPFPFDRWPRGQPGRPSGGARKKASSKKKKTAAKED